MEENVTGRAWSSPHAAEKPGETKAEAWEAFLSTEIGLATRFQGWPWQRKVSVECLRWAGKRKKGEEVESSLQKELFGDCLLERKRGRGLDRGEAGWSDAVSFSDLCIFYADSFWDSSSSQPIHSSPLPLVLAITSTWIKTSSHCAGKNGENPPIGKIMWGSEDISILEAEWQQVMK